MPTDSESWGDAEPSPFGQMSPEQHSINKSRDVDTKLRVAMVAGLLVVFFGLNCGMLYMIHAAFSVDVTLLQAKTVTSAERVISEKVFLALIAATVAQVGAGIIVMVNYLFPKRTLSAPPT